jgi:hypothetical protein
MMARVAQEAQEAILDAMAIQARTAVLEILVTVSKDQLDLKVFQASVQVLQFQIRFCSIKKEIKVNEGLQDVWANAHMLEVPVFLV